MLRNEFRSEESTNILSHWQWWREGGAPIADDSNSTDHNHCAAAEAQLATLQSQVAQLRECLELPLRHPEVFRRMGVKPPSSISCFNAY